MWRTLIASVWLVVWMVSCAEAIRLPAWLHWPLLQKDNYPGSNAASASSDSSGPNENVPMVQSSEQIMQSRNEGEGAVAHGTTINNEEAASISLRGSQHPESVRKQQDDESVGTLCIYQAPDASCAKRKTHPAKLQTCTREADDGVCINFPYAGAVFSCVANSKVSVYAEPGCTSDSSKKFTVACLDMTPGTYFLLCCRTEDKETSDLDCEGLERMYNSQETEVPEIELEASETKEKKDEIAALIA